MSAYGYSRWMLTIVSTSLLLCLSGCGDASSSGSSDAMQRAASVKALCLLKKYQVAQNIHRMQADGAYGSMKDLIASQMVEGELAGAYDKQTTPVAVDGFLFADLEQESDGRALQRQQKSGLCAYPQSGNGGILLMLMDSNDPEEWAVYTSDTTATGGAVRRWPSAAELKDKYTRKGKYTPEEAKREAEKLAK